MEMNLCNSCTNIRCEFQSGIVRTKCAFYMPPHIEPDNCGNYVIINKQAVLEMAYDMSEIDGEHFTEPRMVVDVEDIQNLPPVEPQEKTGHWINKDVRKEEYVLAGKCSVCGQVRIIDKFCSHCGARMVEPQESEG